MMHVPPTCPVLHLSGAPALALPADFVPRRTAGEIVGPHFPKARPPSARWNWKKAFGRRVLEVLLWGLAEDEPPDEGAPMSRDQLFLLLEPVLGAALRPAKAFDDREYYLPTYAQLRWVFDARSVAERAYRPEIFDCEDFACWLRADFALNRYWYAPTRDSGAFAVGTIWGGLEISAGHTANLAVGWDPLKGGAELWLMDSTPDSARRVPGIKPFSAATWPRSINYIVI
jgi:hypothetical protein